MSSAQRLPGTEQSQDAALANSITRALVVRAPEDETGDVLVQLWGQSALTPLIVPSGQWIARGVALPKVGDLCLAIIDAQGDCWISAWVGEAAFPDAPPIGPAGGDLAGEYPNPTVETIDGQPVADVVFTGDPRLSDGRSPTGAAGGDLGDTYPNPVVETVMGGKVPILKGGAATDVGNLGGDLTGTLPNPKLAWVGKPGRVYRNTAYTLAVGWNPLWADTLDRDDGGLFQKFTAGTGSVYTFLAPASGWYRFEGEMHVSGGMAGHRLYMALFTSTASGGLGATQLSAGEDKVGATGIAFMGVSIEDTLYVAAGTYVQLVVYSDVGVPMYIAGSSFNRFAAQRVG